MRKHGGELKGSLLWPPPAATGGGLHELCKILYKKCQDVKSWRENEKVLNPCRFRTFRFSRGERIRTSDLLNPIQQSQQTISLPDKELTSTPSVGCTAGCTSKAETGPAPLSVEALAAALAGLSAADRARLAALLVDQGGAIAPPIATKPAGESAGACTSTPSTDFARRFEAVFDRLDRERGGHNFLSLVLLRKNLADVGRDAFDRGLQDLRRAGRFTMSAAEGRHGLTVEERTAGILEDGTLLLHVSRRQG